VSLYSVKEGHDVAVKPAGNAFYTHTSAAKDKTVDPIWDETFELHICEEAPPALYVQVADKDEKKGSMGEGGTAMPHRQGWVGRTVILAPKKGQFEAIGGKISFKVKFEPKHGLALKPFPWAPEPSMPKYTGTLHVHCIRAEGIRKGDVGLFGGKSDPYVQLTIVCGTKQLPPVKTKVVKKSLDPVWDETLAVWLASDQKPTVLAEVVDWDRVGKGNWLGEAPLDWPSEKQQLTLPLQSDGSKAKAKSTGTLTVAIWFVSDTA
jgi:Ca2+-dependent lipid-binding protein